MLTPSPFLSSFSFGADYSLSHPRDSTKSVLSKTSYLISKYFHWPFIFNSREVHEPLTTVSFFKSFYLDPVRYGSSSPIYLLFLIVAKFMNPSRRSHSSSPSTSIPSDTAPSTGSSSPAFWSRWGTTPSSPSSSISSRTSSSRMSPRNPRSTNSIPLFCSASLLLSAFPRVSYLFKNLYSCVSSRTSSLRMSSRYRIFLICHKQLEIYL